MAFNEDAPTIEQFHLLFLSMLPTAFRSTNYIIKGGANLRYFYGSFRYSQDIDLDWINGEGWKLEEAVDRVLTGRGLQLLTRQAGLDHLEFSTPKLTDTTKRWKIALHRQGAPSEVHTKIEFSNRGYDERYTLQQVAKEIILPYRINGFKLQSYSLIPALEQKTKALAERSETQARDVFDLDLLFGHKNSDNNQSEVSQEYVREAMSRVDELSANDFFNQVVPFLDPDIAPQYSTTEAWDNIQLRVADNLERLLSAPAIDDSLEINPTTDNAGDIVR